MTFGQGGGLPGRELHLKGEPWCPECDTLYVSQDDYRGLLDDAARKRVLDTEAEHDAVASPDGVTPSPPAGLVGAAQAAASLGVSVTTLRRATRLVVTQGPSRLRPPEKGTGTSYHHWQFPAEKGALCGWWQEVQAWRASTGEEKSGRSSGAIQKQETPLSCESGASMALPTGIEPVFPA